MSNLSTLPKGDSAWLLRKAIERIIQQVSVLETNIGSSTTGNSTNTQVIFNDNGTLRGDAAFTFVPSTDILTVTGFKTFGTTQLSTIGILYVGTIATPKLKVDVAGTGITTITQADITGDLTVRTNKLRVTSIGVGANTLTPAASLHSTATTTYDALTLDSDSASTYCAQNWKINGVQKAQAFLDYADDSLLIRTNTATGAVRFGCNDIEQYRIAPLGVFNWYDGAGGTRMTLNSTGLGIGVSPATKLDVRGANNASQATFSGTASRGLLISTRSDGLADDRTVILNAQHSTGSLGQLVIQTAGTDRLLVDSTGNVGIGVTPSAWGRGKGLEVGSIGNAFWGDSSSNGILSISANAYLTTSDLITGWKYATTNPAGRYQISETTHSWYTAASGTINTAITFTQAMTLDASGNLLVGTTSLLGTERLIVTKTTVGSYLARFINTNTTVDTFGITVKYSASAPNDASHNFLYVEDNVNVRAQIYANGGLANYSANNVNLSDARTKTDIKPLTSYWNKIKALELVTFKYKDQTHDDNNIGLISQQVESVAPEFVSNEGFGETPADGVPLKSIYTTDLYHAAIKALQEAMTRIEVLESKLA